jgi:Cu-processing system permease protein
LALDAAVVAAFALCIAALSTVSVLPLALGAAFAVAGKALGATVAYLSQGADGDEELFASYNPLIRLIQWVLPDLSRLDWREWSMYQLAPGAEMVFWSVTMAVAYIVLLLLAASLLFARREFS